MEPLPFFTTGSCINIHMVFYYNRSLSGFAEDFHRLRHVVIIELRPLYASYFLWTKRSGWSCVRNAAAVRAEISSVGLNYQSCRSRAAIRDTLDIDSVSIGLATFPDKIYTVTPRILKSPDIRLHFEKFWIKVSESVSFIVGNININDILLYTSPRSRFIINSNPVIHQWFGEARVRFSK